MFMCARSAKRYNFNEKRRETYQKKIIEEVCKKAENNRETAFRKKHGVISTVIRNCCTQQDYLSRYFRMEESNGGI